MASAFPNSAVFGLSAGGAWGLGDFIGGFASRRANVNAIVALGYTTGSLLMFAVALLMREPMMPRHDLAWTLAAGVVGGGALAAFYGGLSIGKMGIVAPISAVLTAAIPTFYAEFAEGMPSRLKLLGFALALAGIWLVSRPESSQPDHKKSAGVLLAVLSGIGFGTYLILIKQASAHSTFWPLAFSRAISALTVALGALLAGALRKPPAGAARLGLLAGCLDVSGITLFVFAAHSGRLDVAAVLSSLYPAVTALLARMFLQEHLGRWQQLGMLAVFAAIFLIVL